MAVQFNVDQALAKLGELVAKHGPEAVDVAAQVVRVNGAATIAQGVAAGIFCAAGVFATIKLAAMAHREAEKSILDENVLVSVGGFIGGIFTAIATCAAFFVSVSSLFDAWAWVALFSPKLALAHQVLSKIAGI